MTNTTQPMTFDQLRGTKLYLLAFLELQKHFKQLEMFEGSEATIKLGEVIYQACTQQNQAVIAELNAKLEWWRNLFPSITPKAAIEYQTVYDKADKAEALNAELVEALEECDNIFSNLNLCRRNGKTTIANACNNARRLIAKAKGK